ncbi:hypothetical protein D3C84_1207570 [compost metagenome]
MEDALVGNDVHDALRLGEEFTRLGLVAGRDGLLDILHGGTVLGAQRGVRGVELGVLADAFAARCQTGVLFLRLGCHGEFPSDVWG